MFIIKHLFRATKLGWKEEQEGIWFDSDKYAKEEAKAQFKSFNGITQQGYNYTGYEYDGQKYYRVDYLGEFEEDSLPKNNREYLDIKYPK